MIAAIVTTDETKPCIVYWTGKVSVLSVATKTWCNKERPAGDGVLQLPDSDDFCDKCKAAVAERERVNANKKAAATTTSGA